MIYSMTGYAVQMRDIGRGILHLELRTVNSRYLDMNFRIAEEVRIVEPGLREMISGRLNRGKVDCRLNLLPSTTAPRETSLNRALLQQLAALQSDVRDQLPAADGGVLPELGGLPAVDPGGLRDHPEQLVGRSADDLRGIDLPALLRELRREHGPADPERERLCVLPGAVRGGRYARPCSGVECTLGMILLVQRVPQVAHRHLRHPRTARA